MSPDNQNTIQNQDSEKNPIPPTPQESTEPVPEITPVSTSADMPPEAPESPKNTDIPFPSIIIIPKMSLFPPPAPKKQNPKNYPPKAEKLKEFLNLCKLLKPERLKYQ